MLVVVFKKPQIGSCSRRRSTVIGAEGEVSSALTLFARKIPLFGCTLQVGVEGQIFHHERVIIITSNSTLLRGFVRCSQHAFPQ
jgi:hypothetical protein